MVNEKWDDVSVYIYKLIRLLKLPPDYKIRLFVEQNAYRVVISFNNMQACDFVFTPEMFKFAKQVIKYSFIETLTKIFNEVLANE